MNKCTGIMGWVFGNKFVAMITYGTPTISMKDISDTCMMPGDYVSAFIASRPESYHGSICQRCGAVVGGKK